MSSATPRLLVIGGNGFIGRHVVEHARIIGWDVTSLGLKQSVENPLEGVGYVSADIADKASLHSALPDNAFDYVVNCGGYIDHAPYFNGGKKAFEAHATGVYNLAECIDRSRLKRFINIGSSDEYGNAPAPQSETLREVPISPYSLGKTAATHFLQTLYRTEQFPAVTLRLFLTYGPGQDARRFLPQIIRGCLDDAAFPVSAGEQLRDFCYIDDTMRAIFLALTHDAALGEVINVGSGIPVTIRDVIQQVHQLIGKGTPHYGAVPYRPSENMALYADATKARQLLGWQPQVSLATGLRNTVEWIKACHA
jgi:nucleoside-diphosphate-sugar epimerase